MFRMVLDKSLTNNFLVVGTQRTGSTALVQALNNSPEVACGGEWTQTVPWYNKIKITERALRGDLAVLAPHHIQRMDELGCSQARWVGFKLLFRSSDKWLFHPRFAPALWLDCLEDYRRWLAKRRDIHVIHIVRCDAGEWLKSKYLADATGLYGNQKYPEGIKLTIPVWRAINRIRSKNWVDGRLALLDRSNPYLRLYYEDLLACEDDALIAALRFLQCDPQRLMKAKQHREIQSRAPALDYLSNYDQLITELGRRNLLRPEVCERASPS